MMLTKVRESKIAIIFVLLFLCVCAPDAAAQVNRNSKTDLPVWQNYKGVVLGMTAAEVRQKLGAPKSGNEADFFYIFSETETADIIFSGEKVTTISVSFTEEHANPPKFEDVFSKSVKAEPKPDGAIFKKVDYPDAGFWISYNRMAGEKAMVMIVITSTKKL